MPTLEAIREGFMHAEAELPVGRYVLCFAYWGDRDKPIPGQHVIRDSLRYLGTDEQLCEVTISNYIPVWGKTPPFAVCQVKALRPGLWAGHLAIQMDDLNATMYHVSDSLHDTPDLAFDALGFFQETADTAEDAGDSLRGMKNFLARWGPEIGAGLVVALAAAAIVKLFGGKS